MSRKRTDIFDIFDDADGAMPVRSPSTRGTHEWPVKDRVFPPCEEILDWAMGTKCLSAKRFIRFVQKQSKPGTNMRNWFGAISQTLRTKIIRRINMSPLHVDHGISRKLADAHWHLLSRASRRFLQKNFVFTLCKKCNGSKSSKLWEREALTNMYVDTYHDGSIAAAKHDARWLLLEETLDVFYQRKEVV